MCIHTLHTKNMIKSFAHKELEKLFKAGSKSCIQAAHENRLSAQLSKLDSAKSPQDMSLPAWQLHPLKGTLKGYWAVSVSGNWRLTFRFVGQDAEVVDYQDYH